MKKNTQWSQPRQVSDMTPWTLVSSPPNSLLPLELFHPSKEQPSAHCTAPPWVSLLTPSFLHTLCGIYHWVLLPPSSKYISSPTTSHHHLCWTLVEVTIISTWIIAGASYWPPCLHPQPSVVQDRYRQAFSVKSRMVDILGFASFTAPVTIIQLCPCSM